MAKPSITFKSYNPYEFRYPRRRVVLFELLQVIKSLRSAGYAVCVEPDDGSQLNWRQESGLRQLLQDPVVMLCANLSLGVIASLFANMVWDWKSRWTSRERTPILIEIPEGREKGVYDLGGRKADRRVARQTTREEGDWASAYAIARQHTTPMPAYPEPILLEHTPRIVGWGRLSTDDEGLLVDARITDAEIERQLDCGLLGGFSFGALVYDSECSVCGGQYADCNHSTGRMYGGVECIATIRGADLAEISVVAEPANPYARARRVN